MEWTPGETSGDIEDRRDDSGGGGGGGFRPGGIHFGIGGTLILLVLSFVFKTNFFALLSNGSPEGAPISRSAPDPGRDTAEQPEVKFISFVLDDVQKTWDSLLPDQAQVSYHHAKLLLFRDSYPSACGNADTATGPFYCPGDEKVYLDLGFFDELKSRFGASGQFAQAYVLAHEIGHHIQKLRGIESKVRRLQESNPREVNTLSVRLELQADCYAGIWGKTGEQRNFVHDSDIEDGLRAAAAVGDDRLQKMATGHVSPESFTHGSSAQRTEWFKRGLSEGQLSACDTFAAQ